MLNACLINSKKSYFYLKGLPKILITAFFIIGNHSLSFCQVKANFTIVTNGDSCKIRSVVLDGSNSAGPITNYSWKIKNKFTGQNIETGSGSLKTKNFTAPGVYQAILIVTGGGKTDSIVKEIKVYYLPSIDFSADITEGCPPLSVNFTNNSKPGDGIIIKSEWLYGDGKKDAGTTDESVSNVYNVSGLYSPTLIVTNNFGCKNSLTKDKYINIYNQIKPSYSVSNNTYCSLPGTVTFTNTTGDKNFNYTWDFGDGTTLTENANSFTHQYSKAGNFKIQITAKNNTGACTGYSQGDVANTIYVGKPSADFILPTQICAFEKIGFVPKSDPAGIADTGRWYFEDDNHNVDSLNTYHVFRKPGTWKVKLVTFNKNSLCHSDTITKTVTVLSSPEARIIVDKKEGCVAPHLINAQNTTTNGTSYTWNFGDGTASVFKNDLSPVSHSYTNLGDYNLMLSAKGINGCINIDTVKIAIDVPKILVKVTSPSGCMPFALGIKTFTNSLDSITQFSYDRGDGSAGISSTDDSINTIYSSAGSFFLKVNATTKLGCIAKSDSIKIFVDQFCDTDGDSTISHNNGSAGSIEVIKIPDCKQKYSFVFLYKTQNETIISWNMDGDVLSSTSNRINYTFRNPTKKKFVVSVKVKDSFGNILEHGVRVSVVDEKANFDEDNIDFCKNTLVKFRTIGIDSSQISKYYWNYGDYSKLDTVNNDLSKDSTGFYKNGNSSHIYRWKGSFRPMLTIVDKFGCRDSIKQKTEIKVKAPDAQFGIDKGRFCNTTDFNVNFTQLYRTVLTPGTTVKEWNWSFGDNTTSVLTTDSDVPHNYKNTKSYQNFQVRLTITDSEGCVDTKDSNVTSYVPKVAFSTSDTLRCNKFNIAFKNTSLARVLDTNQYTWKYGNGKISKGFNGKMTYADSGIYSVTLIVKDNGGCIDSAFKPAYVKLVKPIASFKIGDDTAKCLGTFSVPFTSTSSYSSTYKWDFGDGETSLTDKQTVYHFYKKSNLYTIKLTVKGLDGCIDSTNKKLQIKGSSENLELKDTLICYGGSFTAIVRGQNISNYYWDFGDFTPTNTLTTQDSVTHIYKKAGTYNPNVIVKTPEGCFTTIKSKNSIVVDSIYVDKISNIDCGKAYAPLKGYSFLKADSLYEWSGPAGAIFNPGKDSLFSSANTAGTYFLQAKKGSCAIKESVNMTTSGIVPQVYAGQDRKQDCLTETTLLNGSSTTSSVKYKWSGPAGTLFLPNDSVNNPEVNTLGKFILTITQKTCSKNDTLLVSGCTLYKKDSTINLCAYKTGKPAVYKGFKLSSLNPAVSDTAASNSTWFGDKKLSAKITDADNHDVSAGDSIYVKIVSKDNSETGRALVVFHIDTMNSAPVVSPLTSLCQGVEKFITASGNNASTFNWIISNDSSHTPSSSNKINIIAGKNNISGKVLEINDRGCNSDTAQFSLPVDLRPTISLVSSDSISTLNYCITANSKKMTGNMPAIGKGVWKIVKNTGNATLNLTDPQSDINGFDTVLDTLVAEWRIDNGSCPTSVSRLTVRPVPAFTPEIYLQGEDNSCKGALVSYKAIPVNATGANPLYSFYNENNQLLRANALDSVYTFSADQSIGIYAIVHSDYPCLYLDSAKSPVKKLAVASKLQSIILQNGDTICENNPPITLNAFDNKIKGIVYEWSLDGKVIKQTSLPEKLVLNSPGATGKYLLKVYNNTCVPDESSWNVKIYDKPDLFLPAELEVEYIDGQETEIPLRVNQLYDSHDSLTINWDKTENLFYYSSFPIQRKNLTSEVSVQNPVYIPQQQDFSTTYKVNVTSGPKKFHCNTSAAIKIYNFIPANIPNAFSPNGDGLNDTWVIKGLVKYPDTKIAVFNRWGNIVYENKIGHNEPWDGTMRGSTLTAGTYYYVIEFNGSQDKSDHKKDGSVTLVF